MKKLSGVLAVVITSCLSNIAFAQQTAPPVTDIKIVPPPFTDVNPDGANQPDWQVKVQTSYLDRAGKLVSETPVVFIVRDGFCTSAKERLVDLQPNGQAKVRQKICVGGVGKGKTVLVGWVFSDYDQHNALTDDTEAMLSYGTKVELTFEGDFVEGVFGEYRVTATKIES